MLRDDWNARGVKVFRMVCRHLKKSVTGQRAVKVLADHMAGLRATLDAIATFPTPTSPSRGDSAQIAMLAARIESIENALARSNVELRLTALPTLGYRWSSFVVRSAASST